MNRLPNLVYIGPDKAASTWLFRLFQAHPDVFVTPAKDLYFFDRYFHKGLDWYAQQFEGYGDEPILAEISHDYLYSSVAARRLTDVLPDARLMICLREPCDRTFSGYMHLVKSGHFKGSFREALQAHPGLVQRSLYGRWLSEYLTVRPRETFYWVMFDELKRDPTAFANKLVSDLGISKFELPVSLQENALPAGRSRCVAMTRGVRAIANQVRDLGFPSLVGKIKSSPLVQRCLYVRYSSTDRPSAPSDVVEELREIFRDDLLLFDELMGTDVSRVWGYQATGLKPQSSVTAIEPTDPILQLAFARANQLVSE